MSISHYTVFIYIFMAFIAAAGLSLSRRADAPGAAVLQGPVFWICSALSVFSVSLVQFWIVVLPVISIESSVLLLTLSFMVSVVVPWTFNVRRIFNYYDQFVSRNFKRFFSAVLVIFFGVLQPFALLYVGEQTASQYLGSSYHLMLASVIGIAGLSTLIGGKKIILISNALFGGVVIVASLLMMVIGGSVLAPMRFVRTFFLEGSALFQANASLQANWVGGFIGISVISWFIWWIDHSAYESHVEQHAAGRSVAALLVSGSLIATAFLFRTSAAAVDAAAGSESLSFLFILVFVSVIFSAFSHSFQSVSTFIAEGFSGEEADVQDAEKQLLIERLAIMLSALLVILVIPFAQMLGSITLMFYIQFLSWSASSAVGTLGVLAVRNTISQEGLFFGIAGGFVAGIVIAVVSGTGAATMQPILGTPYGASGLVVCCSALCAAGGSMMSHKKMIKRSIVL